MHTFNIRLLSRHGIVWLFTVVTLAIGLTSCGEVGDGAGGEGDDSINSTAADPFLPVPKPGFPRNIFFGEIPSDPEGPVLVFVHGLRGKASDWWVGNNMYKLAFVSGYRTAFININRDGSANDDTIRNNAIVLKSLFPKVAKYYDVDKFYVIALSKGALDTQAAMLTPVFCDDDKHGRGHDDDDKRGRGHHKDDKHGRGHDKDDRYGCDDDDDDDKHGRGHDDDDKHGRGHDDDDKHGRGHDKDDKHGRGHDDDDDDDDDDKHGRGHDKDDDDDDKHRYGYDYGLDERIANLVQAVFTIAAPNQGSELADWAFGPGRPTARRLGLLTPGIAALRTPNVQAFRAIADPIFAKAGIPHFTAAGTTSKGNPLTVVTGGILSGLTGGAFNDGLVTLDRSRLPETYAQDLGVFEANHFHSRFGIHTFYFFHHRISFDRSLIASDFSQQSLSGLGDIHNNWIWSMKWFKGKLYVGTGREPDCASYATAEVQVGIKVYPPLSNPCPPDMRDLELSAEIWRFTPNKGGKDKKDGHHKNKEQGKWELVYKSPEDIPIAWNLRRRPTKFTARDIGFRGMAVFEEPDGTLALYVGGVSAASLYEKIPPYDRRGFPPPRILRSVNGRDWAPIPNDPGTFLGDIVKNAPPELKPRGFRSLVSYKKKLYATASDYIGVGFMVASADPARGNDAWQQVSPPATEFPIWTLSTYNDYLYIITGSGVNPDSNGYGVYKTDASGDPPLNFTPIVTDGAGLPEQFRSPNALSMGVFQGKLYVGSNRPTELIRIDPDDNWELVTGEPRFTEDGLKAPLSGFGTGFGNFFNGHFWRMGAFQDNLYLTTWDWSVALKILPTVESMLPLIGEFGFDLYRTPDGVHWTPLTKMGLGQAIRYGGRSLEVTKQGIFVGSAKPHGGGEVWLHRGHKPGKGHGHDDHDDKDDKGKGHDRDPDGSPQNLESVNAPGGNVLLSWEPVPVAARYLVFRATVRPALSYFPPDLEIKIPGTDITLTIQDIIDGKLDPICELQTPTEGLCNLLLSLRDNLGLPGGFEQIGSTMDAYFTETPPTDFQSIYFVVAENSLGEKSRASNIAGGPTKGRLMTFPYLLIRISSLLSRGYFCDTQSAGELLARLRAAYVAYGYADYGMSMEYLESMVELLDKKRRHKIAPLARDELIPLVKSLARNVGLVDRGLIPACSLQKILALQAGPCILLPVGELEDLLNDEPEADQGENYVNAALEALEGPTNPGTHRVAAQCREFGDDDD